jgi:hypothetical protein
MRRGWFRSGLNHPTICAPATGFIPQGRMPEDQPSFSDCIAMLRSRDPLTYEDGYHWLQSRLGEHLDDLIALTLQETDPAMRGKFVELLGDSKDPRALPHLQRELTHPERGVRMWAYQGLLYFESDEAARLAEAFARDNPHEDFL